MGDRLCVKAGSLLLSLVPLVSITSARADEVKPLRLCADPTNLPFSSDDPLIPGVYLEIGQAVGRALGRPISYDWYKSYFGKRTVRATLLAKRCDATIGLPRSDDFMGPAVIFSKPILKEGYVLVSDKTHSVAKPTDLKSLRVAVQFQTTPQNLLAPRGDMTTVTVLSPEEGMEKLAQGKADVAFIWGPIAGWLNATKYQSRFLIQPTEGEGLAWSTAIGFAKESKELRDQIDELLPALQPEIAQLGKKYNFPDGIPMKFSESVEAQGKYALIAAEPSTVGQTKPVTASAGESEAGRVIFNGTCAHCHGPDAIQGERRIDLRRLRLRYGEGMRETYWTTVREGRPAKGMPAWKEVFDDNQLNEILTYLATVQSN